MLVDSALAASTPRLSEMTERFVKAALALRMRRPDTALQLLGSFDSIPLRPDQLEPRWGIRSAAFSLAGDAYLARGDTIDAVRSYRRFLDWWKGDDPLTEPSARRARDFIAAADR